MNLQKIGKLIGKVGLVLTLTLATGAMLTMPRCGSGIGGVYDGKATATKF